jgi:methionyl-tRNA formyltransferase
MLGSAKIAAINFHPGSPDYPGTGCYNFALFEKAARYGITCHHMKEKVDTGDIIAVSYFDIAPNENVETLKLKSMNHMLMCFSDIIQMIYNKQELPVLAEKWRRKPFTRKQLDRLCRVDPLESGEENELRIKATFYPGADGPYVQINDRKFVLQAEERKPIV